MKAKKAKLSLTDIQQGDVLWATGPAGRRPYLVVTRTEMIPVLSAVVVAPVSRTIRRIPQCIPLTVADGMDVDCVATFDSLTVFDPTLFDERITTLPERRMHEICEALAALANC